MTKRTKTVSREGSGFGHKAYDVLLSGIGFYQLALRRRRQLTIVLSASLLLHIVGLLVFGGWVVLRSRVEEVAIFETPPPTQTYEPRKLEHRVKLQKRQRSSSRPSMMPRLAAMKPSDLALPDIKMDPKIIHTTFQPKFKAVSGKGLGAGLGTGYGTSGFGVGVSAVNFFGIKARGEKIAILVDVSVSMVDEERGGVLGYMRVKQRVEEVIEALSEASLFNLIVFGDAASALEKEMVIASESNKKKAKLFLRPFNTEGNWGLSNGNLGTRDLGLKADGGTTRLDIALTAALEQGADTILIISDGAPRVRRGFTAEQNRAWQARLSQWQSRHAGEIGAWQSASVTEEKVWIPPQPARPASKGPPKEGEPVDRGSPARPGRWEVRRTRNVARPKQPQRPDPGWWTLTDFLTHLRKLHEELYVKEGKKPPVIHAIGYQIDNEGHSFLNGLAREYRGNYRRVRSLR